MKIDIKRIVKIAEEAGRAVMDVYSREDLGTTYKDDCSPLTMADTASNAIIVKALGELNPKLPVLSEESKAVPYDVRRSWEGYWLVDPLDGTKEFVKRNGEFTVNIALIRNGFPAAGVVSAPAVGLTYYAVAGEGSLRRKAGEHHEKIRVCDYGEGPLRIVASRSHAGEALALFLEELGPAEFVSMGSSLKLCLVAEGAAELYPRLGPTMEWDTAAAQCIVEEAGGLVTDVEGSRLMYNKESLLNRDFFVSCCESVLKRAIGCRKAAEKKRPGTEH